MQATRIVSCLIASLVAILISVVISLLVAINVPYMVGPDQARPIPSGKAFTLEDLRQAERDAKERMKKQVEQFERESTAERLEEIKRRGLPISWIPWLVLPVVFRLRSAIEILPLLVLPAVLALTPIVAPWEVMTFAVALILGFMFANYFLRRRFQKDGVDKSMP